MTTAAKRKLYLHIGPPKTGTSALQFFLYENREKLRASGIVYPANQVLSPQDPRHQFFFTAIRHAKSDRFEASMKALESELDHHIHTVILSSEGFYHHIHEFIEQSWMFIRKLANTYSMRIIVYLRPQYEYIESLYRQYMQNPRGINAEFGSGMTIHELMERPRIMQNFDYHESLMKWASVVGEDRIIVRRYPKNVVADFLSVLNIKIKQQEPCQRRNVSLCREMAELLRCINTSFDDQTRERLITAMEEHLARYPLAENKTFLSPSQGSALMERYREGNCRVARTWLQEDDLFPGYAVGGSVTWEPVRIDREQMLSWLSGGTIQNEG